MKQKIVSYFLLSYIFLFFQPIYCQAESFSADMSFEFSNTELKRGDDLHVFGKIVSHKPEKLLSLEMKVNFDKNNLIFKDSTYKSKNEKEELITKCNRDTITLLYTNQDGITLNPGIPTRIFELKFKVKKDAHFGPTQINAAIKNMYDKNLCSININKEIHSMANITMLGSSLCTLKTLSPSSGTFNLPFEPDKYSYFLDVPYDTKEIDFAFETENPESVVKISRHKLNAAGKTTDIKITVMNKKEKVKLVYLVRVQRAAKPTKEELTYGFKGELLNEQAVGSPKSNVNKKTGFKNPKTNKSTKTKFYSDESPENNEDENSDDEFEDDENGGNNEDDKFESFEKELNEKSENNTLAPTETFLLSSSNTDNKNNFPIILIVVTTALLGASLYTVFSIVKVGKEFPNFIKYNSKSYINLD